MWRSRKFWYGLLSFLGLVGFLATASLLSNSPSEATPSAPEFDQAVFHFLKSFRTDLLTKIMADLTALGSMSVLTLFTVGTIAALILFRQRSRIVELIVVGLGAVYLSKYLKLYYARPRPEITDRLVLATEYSFPSGHSLGAAAVYLAIGLLSAEIMRKRSHKIFWIALVSFVILLVGVSRIYLGVHYATDVLAGFSLGMSWTLFIALVFELIRGNTSVK